MTEGRLTGAIAVITGASRGIGAAIARAYAREGARLVLCARSLEAVASVAQAIRDGGGEAVATACDVTEDTEVTALVETTHSVFGIPSIVVNNAGMYGVARFLDTDIELYRRFMDVNYFGTVRVTRAFLPGMRSAGSGKFVNMASTAGRHGSRFSAHYNGAKHAVVGFTRSIAVELAGDGIRVNAICPGFVNTSMLDEALPAFAEVYGLSDDEVSETLLKRVPIGRMLEPEEVAQLAVYLGSRESDGMTGQALTISGGMVLV